MRTTLRLDDDVAAAVRRLQADDGIGLSDAVNSLVRRGLSAATPIDPYRIEPVALGARVDYTNIGDTLDLLDEFDAKSRRAG